MAKKAKPVRKKAQQRSNAGTNWYVIGGIISVGLLMLFGLLFVSLRGAPAAEILPLAEYCDENPERCVFEGDRNAPVTIVEVSDFGCPHCRNFNLGTLDLLQEAYVDPGDVLYISLPYALSGNTMSAANAAMCAGAQGRYPDFQRAMFQQFDSADYMSRDSMVGIANTLGLEMDAFEGCVDSGTYGTILSQNVEAAASVSINSTPSFYVNDTKLEGNQPLANFQRTIESYLTN